MGTEKSSKKLLLAVITIWNVSFAYANVAAFVRLFYVN